MHTIRDRWPDSSDLTRRVEIAHERSSPCSLCPGACGSDRLAGQHGDCGIASDAIVASSGPHFGEESVLVGYHGSGTVFFSGCNLQCVFCQNHDISQERAGAICNTANLASLFLQLQARGCHNLNLVTPSHVIHPILAALEDAIARGFHLPVVYNSSGYDSVESLKLLDGLVDIYMPDLKYSENMTSVRYSGVSDYWEIATAALTEMHRQVGDLRIEAGLATRGLLVRHLVLPHNLSGTEKVMTFLAEDISRESWVNVMDQYRPAYRADEFRWISRPVSSGEYRAAVRFAKDHGIHRGIPFDALG